MLHFRRLARFWKRLFFIFRRRLHDETWNFIQVIIYWYILYLLEKSFNGLGLIVHFKTLEKDYALYHIFWNVK